MANTYTQLYVQIVFAVQNRNALISESFREELQKYATGIIQNNTHKMLAIYCMPDHTHIMVGLNPVQSISSLVNDIKSNSSKWINEQKKLKFPFNWQDGYGAFSYDRNRLYTTIDYINNQKQHHAKFNFKEEYLKLLKDFDIDYQEQYLFKWLE